MLRFIVDLCAPLLLLLLGAADCAHDPTPLCVDLCSHAKSCGNAMSSFCGSGCGGLREASYQPDAVEALRTCMTETCDVVTKDCFEKAAKSLQSRPQDLQFRSACRSSLCMVGEGACADGNHTEVLRPESLERLLGCFNGQRCDTTGSVLSVRTCVFDVLPP